MANKLTSYRGGQAVTPGDNLRVISTACAHNTETTILNVASGGAIVDSILLEAGTSTAGTRTYAITNIKTTVDGGSERTHDFNGFIYAQTTAQNTGDAFEIPFKISANTSLTIKITRTNTESNSVDALVIYRIPA